MHSAPRRCKGSVSGSSSCTTGTSTLIEVIRDHASQGSEANQVVQSYAALSARDHQDLINILHSL